MLANETTPAYITDLAEKYIAPKKSIEDKDFYEIELCDSVFKDDVASMEAPIFSLSKNKDKEKWEWTSVDGKKSIKVIPNAEYGRATIFDKDVLIYAISCLVERKNEGLPPTKTVRFSAYSYLKATNRDVSRCAYVLRTLVGNTKLCESWLISKF